MAYLPPAGKRCLTDSKLTFLPTMSEITNPAYTEKMLDAIQKNAPQKSPHVIIPAKISEPGEIGFRPSKKYPEFQSDASHMRPFCMGTPSYKYRSYDTRADCQVGQPDLRQLPYGLPPETYDVKVRANWFDHWKEANYTYTGAFKQWERRFGQKYFYPVATISKPPRFTGKKTDSIDGI